MTRPGRCDEPPSHTHLPNEYTNQLSWIKPLGGYGNGGKI